MVDQLSWDLITAFLVVAVLAAVAFRAGRSLGASDKCLGTGIASIWLLPAAVMGGMFFAWQLSGRLTWAMALPCSAVILWSNLTPVLLGFAAGLSLRAVELRDSVRVPTALALGLLGVAYLFVPIARPYWNSPDLQETGLATLPGGICLQSHESTCAPASAVTLLKLHGIESTEKQMAGVCLTSEQGSEALGLYRGLHVACRDSPFRVGIASTHPREWLLFNQVPNVALVRFPNDEFLTPSTRQLSWMQRLISVPANLFGGREREGHAVVVLGREEGKWLIADPAIGLVRWSDQELQTRYTGDAMYLDRAN